ncbi:MAG TPA: 4-hydroxybenzoate octaprenyltransferase, partial [Beijerinckiaceae bacterium]|nr:4-hydroxybenzoate octaprenyltransferase [Beijerinckiaceae bacterium]
MTASPSGGFDDPKPADSVSFALIDRVLPLRWRPYARLARLDRPIGWWLLLLPCWWSSAL